MLYKETKDYRLYLGDVLEVLKQLPSESVDMIVTSPPYNINLKDRKDTDIATYDNWDDDMPWDEYCNWQKDILDECYRIVRTGGVMFYNHKDKFVNETYRNPITILFSTKWQIKQNVIWNRKSCLSYNAGMFGDVYENVYYCYKEKSPKTKTRHNVLGTVWELDIERNNSHPAPFPLELPVRCIYSIFDDEENKVILDPFSGSGTTGVASLLLGHKYIGIDISEKYLKKSIKRLENYESETERAQLELDRHFVKGKYENPKKIGNQLTIFEI